MSILRPTTSREPEFSAYEINALRRHAEGPYADADYYQRCLDFLMQFEEGEITWDRMSAKQRGWLLSIQRMVAQWV